MVHLGGEHHGCGGEERWRLGVEAAQDTKHPVELAADALQGAAQVVDLVGEGGAWGQVDCKGKRQRVENGLAGTAPYWPTFLPLSLFLSTKAPQLQCFRSIYRERPSRKGQEGRISCCEPPVRSEGLP